MSVSGKNLEKAPLLYNEYLRKYGPLVKERVFRGPTLVHVFDPLDMETIYRSDNAFYPIRFSHRALSEYRKEFWRISDYGTGGLLSSNGREWEELRKAVGDDLLHKQSNEAFEEITNDLVAEIENTLPFNSGRFSLLPMLSRWSLECMGAAAIGQRIGALEDDVDERILKFIQCLHNSQEALFYTHNFPKIFTRKWYKQFEESQKYIFSFLRRRTSDVLYKYYKINEKYQMIVENENPIRLHKCMAYNFTKKDMVLDDGDIKTLIMDMFLEGVLSTAHVLAFALFYLANKPEIQDSVRETLFKKFPNPDDKISSKPVDTKILNVLLETMRLNPPQMGTSRVLQENLVLSRYLVPKGTTCILHHQVASMQEERFYDASEFIPDRMESPLTNDCLVACNPFGMGRRACPGKGIAMSELAIGLSVILKHFAVHPCFGTVGTNSGYINKPDKEIVLRFSKL